MHKLERTALVPAPLHEVFEFFSDPHNLARITPKGMGFDITQMDELPIRPGFHRSWRHEHTFEDRHGQTLMRDRIDYEMPFGIIGSAAQRFVVNRQLRKIFDYRTRKIRRLFAPSAAATPLGS